MNTKKYNLKFDIDNLKQYTYIQRKNYDTHKFDKIINADNNVVCSVCGYVCDVYSFYFSKIPNCNEYIIKSII